MLHDDRFAVGLVTFLLLIYCELLQFESTFRYALIIGLCSPVLICWMVYVVIKKGKYNGKELGEEEFGYQDKEKEDLGVF